MKPLLISESDISGGAALAAYRLHKGLLARDIHSILLVQNKLSSDNTVIGPSSNFQKGIANLKISLDHLPKLIYTNRSDTVYHLQWFPCSLAKKFNSFNPDLLHLHWICRAFVNVSTLARIKKPIIWTFHDMWPFTGGCHYAGDCEGYKHSCGSCPKLGSKFAKDISRWTLRRKKKLWKNINLYIVTPSKWMKSCVEQSSLFKNYPIDVIPNGIDLTLFRPISKRFARIKLGLPLNKKLILFGAIDATKSTRKGFQLLLSAMKSFSHSEVHNKTELVIFGASNPRKPIDFGLNASYMGRLHDEISLSLVFSACDVFVAPSKEDNLPNTIMEAMACGTPCVAFSIGGIPEMVGHKINGYLAQPFSIEDLASGIKWIIEDDGRNNTLSASARNKVEANFDLGIVAKRYTSLYERILQNKSW